MSKRTAFSLVELVIVVAIFAVLAAMALPRFSQAVASSKDRAVDQHFRQIEMAAESYAAEHQNKYPLDSLAGVIPPELTQYLPENALRETYFGNNWDWNSDSGPEWAGLPPAIVLWGTGPTRANQFDQTVDDGNDSAGNYYYYRDGLVRWLRPPGF